jgi:hypothetical protein
MRDSINYNLKYFIMRMSGTRPIKNTVRKSPIRQDKPAAKKSNLRSKEFIVQKSVKEKGFVGELKKAKVRKSLDAATKASDATKAKIKAIEEKNNPTKKPTATERQAKVTELRSKSKEERGVANKTAMDKYKTDFKAKADKKAGEKNAMERSKANANRGTKTGAPAETSIKTPTPGTKSTTETQIKTPAPGTKPAGKPSAKPTATETSAKTPPIQMKKSGMKKKY